MTLRFAIFTLFILILAAACQSELPPREILIEVTVEQTRIVVVTATAPQSPGPVVQEGTSQNPEATVMPTQSSTSEATVTPDVFPTPIIGQISVADQTFQNARMFWLQPISQIWIVQTNAEGVNIWIVQDDLFEDGMLETDPSLVPPAEGLIQPIRGFGFLWRNDETLRSQIGWAISEELGYTTNYEYHWGGTVDENNVYFPGPGYHLVETYSQEIYRFDEETRTWDIVQQETNAATDSDN